jgi:hypothetical protein
MSWTYGLFVVENKATIYRVSKAALGMWVSAMTGSDPAKEESREAADFKEGTHEGART